MVESTTSSELFVVSGITAAQSEPCLDEEAVQRVRFAFDKLEQAVRSSEQQAAVFASGGNGQLPGDPKQNLVEDPIEAPIEVGHQQAMLNLALDPGALDAYIKRHILRSRK